MAQKVTVTLTDDLDGTEAQDTVHFGLDGKSFEIDLSHANASKLRSIVQPYLLNARKAGGPVRRQARATTDRTQNTAIREWARKQGITVKDRGRIPADIVERFQQEA
jgi:hypothetical protein